MVQQQNSLRFSETLTRIKKIMHNTIPKENIVLETASQKASSQERIQEKSKNLLARENTCVKLLPQTLKDEGATTLLLKFVGQKE